MKNNKIKNVILVLAASLVLASCTPNAAPSSEASSNSQEASSSDASSSQESSSEPEKAMAGTGTKADPYLPLTAKHWESLQDLICDSSALKYVKLTQDIALSGEYSPLGTVSKPVNAVIWGNGHTISGLSITKAVAGVTAYGLFGAINGGVTELTVSGSIALTAPDGQSFVGLVAGAETNATFLDVHAEGSIAIAHDSTLTKDVVCVGGLIGYASAVSSTYVSINLCSAKVDVDASSNAASYAGGLVGYISTTVSSLGITGVNNAVVQANYVKAASVAGGLVGYSSYYTSVVNSYASVGTVSAVKASVTAAGGLVGAMSSETGIVKSLANVDTVTAGASSSYVGDIAGLATDDDYANGYGRTAGTLLYENHAKGAALTGANKTAIAEASKFTLDSLTVTLLTSLQYSSDFWTLSEKALPSQKHGADVTYDSKVTFTVALNNGTTETTAFDSTTDSFNPQYANQASYADHSYINTYYDAAGTADYRWYIPVNGSETLYSTWFDTTKIAGFYGGASAVNGVLYFGKDGSLAWLMSDYYSATGSYWTDGTNLVFNTDFYQDEVATIGSDGLIKFIDPNDEETEYSFTKKDGYFGYWKDASGRSLYLDGNGGGAYYDGSADTSITYTKDTSGFVTLGAFGSWDASKVTESGDSIAFTLDDGDAPVSMAMSAFNGIPDYSGKGYVATFASSASDGAKQYSFKLLANGNVEVSKNAFTSIYGYGGYRASDNTLVIKSSGASAVAGTFTYNPAKKVLVKSDGSSLAAQTGTFSKLYATSDATVRIFAFSDANYLVMNNKLDTTDAITGTLADGQTISIGSDDYTVSGTTLTKKNAVDYSVLVNTYEMFIGTATTASSNVLVLAADKTGTYNGTAITYTFDGTTLKFSYNGTLDFTLTWNGTAKTLTGTMSDGDTTTNITFKVKTVTPATTTMIGTFTGTVTTAGVNKVTATVVITADNKITYTVSGGSAVEGTWTGDSTKSITASWDDFDGDYDSESGTITYSSASDSITLDLSGAFSVAGTIARAA